MSFVWLQMVKPTVISTFCGTGGSSLGYKWAGYKELLAVDFDAHAVECFKLNFPEVPVWHKSVIDITGQQILDFCKIKRFELDVFDGSPPYQGFSTAGKREVCDSRNDLFMHYVRLIDEIQPKVFVMENVTGMAKGKMKGKFIEIMTSLKSLNYQVKCKQMNAKYYGVPQSRERLIFIGLRKDIEKAIVYPKPIKKITSIKDAIGRDGHIEYRHNYSKGKFSFAKSSFSKPCLTITKTGRGWTVYPYKFTVQELCRLCSFPINWKLGDNYQKAYERLGNAVMPKFMQAIAETIKTEMLANHGTIK